MGSWNKAVVGVVSISIFLSIGMILVFGLFWQMLTEPIIIDLVVLGHALLFISVARFANKYPYRDLRNWMLGFWIFAIFILTGFFILTAALLLLFLWWAGMALVFLITEFTLFTLAHYLADHQNA